VLYSEALGRTALEAAGPGNRLAGAAAVHALALSQVAHAQYRHHTAIWLQRSLVSSLAAVVFGDASGLSSLLGSGFGHMRLSPDMLATAARDVQAIYKLTGQSDSLARSVYAQLCAASANTLAHTPQELQPYSMAAHCEARKAAKLWPAVPFDQAGTATP
jgi:hypothetical protein